MKSSGPNRLVIPLFAVFIFVLSGCATMLGVIRSSNPSPYVRHPVFMIEALDFRTAFVNLVPESQWLATRSPAQQLSWELDKESTNRWWMIHTILGAGPDLKLITSPAQDPEAFIIHPRVVAVDLGGLTFLTELPLQLLVNVVVTDASGFVHDEFNVRAAVPWILLNPSIGGRLNSTGILVAQQAIEYIRQRCARH